MNANGSELSLMAGRLRFVDDADPHRLNETICENPRHPRMQKGSAQDVIFPLYHLREWILSRWLRGI